MWIAVTFRRLAAFAAILLSVIPFAAAREVEEPPLVEPSDWESRIPAFEEVSVHDPSILKVGETYWIVGSHLAVAKSEDLMRWTLVGSGVRDGNPIMPDVREQLSDVFDWSTRRGLWAGCFARLNDGRFYYYYCSCEGRSPLSALGVAVADRIDGPYTDLQILLRSGRGVSEDGARYDVDIHPNAIDPHVFYDADNTLWMVYGSWSGGIFILRMDPETGRQLPDQGYGKKLMGGRCPVEGPFIQYSPQTGYYYLFTSFGELSSRGGYNLRMARSKAPDGPYFDPQGNNMIACVGTGVNNRRVIEPYGAKMMGNFRFLDQSGKPTGHAYVSPGHNSTCYDGDKDKYYLIFHTRFPDRGERFEVRVHQMFLNADGWFVVAPHRYTGETISEWNREAVAGEYAFVHHGLDITDTVKDTAPIALQADGAITGAVSGQWEKRDGANIRLTIDGVAYDGVALRQWDSGQRKRVMAITALSQEGTAVWASGF